MKKQVIVLSRFNYKKLIDSLTDKQKAESAFIQINDPSPAEPFSLPLLSCEAIQKSSENVLNLWFDDAEEEFILLNGKKVELFTDQMAEQIIDFILQNQYKNSFFIHCTMGQCRSGAVGEFIADIFEVPYMEFKRQNPQIKPNTLVKTTLWKVYNKFDR